VKLSEQGVTLLIEREGMKKRAYTDTKGIWTIGVGHTGPEVYDGLYWTEEQCREVFLKDVARFERSVNDCVTVSLEQHQFDALVSFAFNCGEMALPHSGVVGGPPSSILRALNAGDYEGATVAFNNWMRDPEVRTRRAAEREQFAGRHFQARYP
jgi:lysozyme